MYNVYSCSVFYSSFSFAVFLPWCIGIIRTVGINANTKEIKCAKGEHGKRWEDNESVRRGWRCKHNLNWRGETKANWGKSIQIRIIKLDASFKYKITTNDSHIYISNMRIFRLFAWCFALNSDRFRFGNLGLLSPKLVNLSMECLPIYWYDSSEMQSIANSLYELRVNLSK